MNSSNEFNYNRIATIIDYIKGNFREQPGLDQLAEKVHLSSFHFQRLFTEWAGITPKKFLQYISLEYAKKVLKDQNATLFDTAFRTGFSGTGRLHDLFINIEGMTPAEYKNGGKNIFISFNFGDSPFGKILTASTSKGICHMAFVEDETRAIASLKHKFPNAAYQQKTELYQQNALQIFQLDWSNLPEIKLHLKGTDFQLKVWETLLKIPMGNLTTYSSIAGLVNNPNASRAVGTAIGSNPVAYLIPCHRVIKSTGDFGDYMWGQVRKTAIIGWEAAKTEYIEV